MTATPALCTVIASVFCVVNVASNDWSRGRITDPFAQCSGAGFASTGRISPPPGWSPTLLSPNDLSQYQTSRPSWSGNRSAQFGPIVPPKLYGPVWRPAS